MSVLPTGVRHRRCDNPGPMTLTGTNSYVLTTATGVVVIDPGPQDAAHRDALMGDVRDMAQGHQNVGAGARRVVVLLTHHHDDHEGGAHAFVEALAQEGFDVELVGGSSGRATRDGELIGDLQVLHTPGHTRDSVCAVVERGGCRALFSGDTLLGEGSSFVAHPDGDLTAYLASLDVLLGCVEDGPAVLAPGHGPVGGDAGAVIEQYREHREARLDEVRSVVASLPQDAAGEALVTGVIDGVYADVGLQLRPAVEAIVKAQLVHLGRFAGDVDGAP